MKPNYETIYLVPTDYDGGQLTYSWCDCPAPGEGMDPEDAIKYVRADLVPASNEVLAKRIAELTNERDAALAQLVEAQAQAVESINPVEFVSIALRHAEVKGDFDYSDVTDALKFFANQIRQQAKSDAATLLEAWLNHQIRQQAKAGE